MTTKQLLEKLVGEKEFVIEAITGGNINQVYKVYNPVLGPYIVKVNENAKYPQLFEKEKNGLLELRKNKQLFTPAVIKVETIKNDQCLLLEYIEEKLPSDQFWINFGTGLAAQHQITNNNFGFYEDNYIGSLVQHNAMKQNWTDFLVGERFIPMLKLAVDKAIISHSERKKLEAIYSFIDELWPKEKPALLHGDLWAGNFLVGNENKPVLIDPATYYGHREMDIGMMHLFGGFNKLLFNHYNIVYPLEAGWENRLKYNQLYPLLVHLNIFGRIYLERTLSITNEFL